jgi:hypothetical protein
LGASFHVKQSSRPTRPAIFLNQTMHSTCTDHVNRFAFRALVLRRARSIAKVLIEVAAEPYCLSAPASCTFREVRDVALFEVNPGTGTAFTLGSWPQPVGRNDFPRRRTPPSSRTKIAAPLGPPLPLRSQALQRTGPLPIGSPTRPNTGAALAALRNDI